MLDIPGIFVRLLKKVVLLKTLDTPFQLNVVLADLITSLIMTQNKVFQ